LQAADMFNKYKELDRDNGFWYGDCINI